ncbi:MAG: stage II sporulation protein D [Halanaerobiales bacterium]
MWGKTGVLILIIFMVLIIIPVLLVRGLFWQKHDTELLLKVYDHRLNKIVTMELDTYLRGVLAAEMPALYHVEALKAQAVAARSYTLKQLPRFGGPGSQKYPGADVSTDYTDCQAYLSETEMKEKWGFVAFFYNWSRINQAVEETHGQVLTYNGQVIDAVYHANSGGVTEDAEYVWGRNTPYLRSIDSPHDSENERSYKNIYYFSMDKLREKLDINHTGNIDRFSIEKRSDSGRVLEVIIAGKQYTGLEIREKLALSSTKFEVKVENDTYTFICFGRGHGVGMSQDGANGLAKSGYNYKQILNHYYKHVELKRFRTPD